MRARERGLAGRRTAEADPDGQGDGQEAPADCDEETRMSDPAALAAALARLEEAYRYIDGLKQGSGAHLTALMELQPEVVFIREAIDTLQFDLAALTIERDALRRLIEQPNPAVERAFRFGYRAAERAIAIDYPHITVEIDAEAVALVAFQAEREGR
jgi:hypothetical protein